MRYLCLLLCCFFMTACGPNPQSNAPAATNFVGQDITGASFTPPLQLTAHTGDKVSINDFKGKAVVLFFGFTHCPDVCPTTMNELKQTMKLLGNDANQVQVLFVSVDPERDTTEVLAKYVPFFDERFIGLTGTPEEVAANMAAYKVHASKVPSENGEGYSVDHSAGLYVFDKTGAVRIYMNYGQKPAEIASDIKQIL